MTTELSPEEKLKAVIQAQVAGGYNVYGWFIEDDKRIYTQNGANGIFYVMDSGGVDFHVLQVLLDSSGCKAAYGEQEHNMPKSSNGRLICKDKTCNYWVDWEEMSEWDTDHCWEYKQHDILAAWHSTDNSAAYFGTGVNPLEGNNYLAAINVAFNLLPKS